MQFTNIAFKLTGIFKLNEIIIAFTFIEEFILNALQLAFTSH